VEVDPSPESNGPDATPDSSQTLEPDSSQLLAGDVAAADDGSDAPQEEPPSDADGQDQAAVGGADSNSAPADDHVAIPDYETPEEETPDLPDLSGDQEGEVPSGTLAAQDVGATRHSHRTGQERQSPDVQKIVESIDPTDEVSGEVTGALANGDSQPARSEVQPVNDVADSKGGDVELPTEYVAVRVWTDSHGKTHFLSTGAQTHPVDVPDLPAWAVADGGDHPELAGTAKAGAKNTSQQRGAGSKSTNAGSKSTNAGTHSKAKHHLKKHKKQHHGKKHAAKKHQTKKHHGKRHHKAHHHKRRANR
jgi:hypothetical protein